MTELHHSQLGKTTHYDQDYDPKLLFPIARATNRASLGLAQTLPFQGEDLWTAYELSWLDQGGKPNVGVARFRVPADSPFMIESKSFKLYLNSLNQLRLDSHEALCRLLVTDLSSAAGAAVVVEILALNDPQLLEMAPIAEAICLDHLPAENFEYQPNARLLRLYANPVQGATSIIEESLYSDLLRSNCPVTGQPDWGSVFIRYRGPKIDRESLLRYIVSFRQCQDFHEHCVERMFVDLKRECRCQSLSVYARYTRRGGLDINPYRATTDYAAQAENIRLVRQ